MFWACLRTHLRKARLHASILSALDLVTTGVSAIGFVALEGDARKDEPPPKAEGAGADVPKPGKAVAAGAGAGAPMKDANGLPPADLGKPNPADAWPGAGGGAVSLTFAKMPAPLAPAPMPSMAT